MIFLVTRRKLKISKYLLSTYYVTISRGWDTKMSRRQWPPSRGLQPHGSQLRALCLLKPAAVLEGGGFAEAPWWRVLGSPGRHEGPDQNNKEELSLDASCFTSWSRAVLVPTLLSSTAGASALNHPNVECSLRWPVDFTF